MTRAICNHCERPIKTCICCYFTQTANKVNIIVLQHPSEVKQTKGSVALLKHSLSNCTVFVGEDFTEHQQLQTLIKLYADDLALLYPSEDAEELTGSNYVLGRSNKPLSTLIVLDGTWKKAYKLFQLNPFLHQLTHVKLANNVESLYAVRKTNKVGGLSTLEACCHALACLEGDDNKYQKLLKNFVEFNEMQLAFR